MAIRMATRMAKKHAVKNEMCLMDGHKDGQNTIQNRENPPLIVRKTLIMPGKRGENTPLFPEKTGANGLYIWRLDGFEG